MNIFVGVVAVVAVVHIVCDRACNFAELEPAEAPVQNGTILSKKKKKKK
jgi:hypothetical protein